MLRWPAAAQRPLRAWLLIGASVVSAASAASPAASPMRRVGTLELRACGAMGAYCGQLDRALDPLGRVPGTVSVYFEYYPHTDARASEGVLVATEGGPGYPATDSRDSYLHLFSSLHASRDVLIMDNRGTGRSGAVDCSTLQRDVALTIADVGACGTELGSRAPLYSTAYAADDLAAVLDALQIRTIDLYGDSYGTFFAQVFAVRHGERLRTLTLDGAYPVAAPDLAWYADYAPAMRRKFNRACERSLACRAVPGSSIEHIEPALAELRRRPFYATAADADGALQQFTASAGALATVMFGSAPGYATLRETDAAARAFSAGDRLPLLRLMAESNSAVDSRDPTRDPVKFSAGLAAAVMCHDAPQVFDMRLAPPARRAALAAALQARAAQFPDAYAPFTFDEYRQMPPDYEFIEECVDWPVADAAHPAGAPFAPGSTFPATPVLFLSGELDNITPAADAETAARQFPHATHVIVENGWHVNALASARSACPAELVRRFIADPERGVRDTATLGCRLAAPALRLAGPFVRGFVRAVAAEAAPGNHAAQADLVTAGAVVATLGDVLPRLAANSSGHGVGLRGGRFTVTASGERLKARLYGVRWAEDLAVSGTVEWNSRRDESEARLRYHAKSGTSGQLRIRWTEGAADARARIEGHINHRVVAASCPAP